MTNLEVIDWCEKYLIHDLREFKRNCPGGCFDEADIREALDTVRGAVKLSEVIGKS